MLFVWNSKINPSELVIIMNKPQSFAPLKHYSQYSFNMLSENNTITPSI